MKQQSAFVRDGIFKEVAGDLLLAANKCRKCGQLFFPKTDMCFSCYSRDLEEVTLSRTGTLHSYTVVYMPSLKFEPPYALGFIDLPEGIRVFSPLQIIADKPFEVGMAMEMVVTVLWKENDIDVVGYMFKPA